MNRDSQLILPEWIALVGWPASSAQLLQFLLERKRRAGSGRGTPAAEGEGG